MSKAVEILMVVDRSGSMQSIAQDAIGGYNRFLAEQKSIPGEANLTLILFDHEYSIAYSGKLAFAAELNSQNYVPRGATALNDAIGRALGELSIKRPEKAIVCVLTDGQENASKEWKSELIRKRIAEAEAAGWQFHYLSAAPSGFADANTLGFVRSKAFAADAAGTAQAFNATSACVRSYRGGN
jgi:uncharacterized protein with von Willebrand factor type A (vWA) domain